MTSSMATWRMASDGTWAAAVLARKGKARVAVGLCHCNLIASVAFSCYLSTSGRQRDRNLSCLCVASC